MVLSLTPVLFGQRLFYVSLLRRKNNDECQGHKQALPPKLPPGPVTQLGWWLLRTEGAAFAWHPEALCRVQSAAGLGMQWVPNNCCCRTEHLASPAMLAPARWAGTLGKAHPAALLEKENRKDSHSEE